MKMMKISVVAIMTVLMIGSIALAEDKNEAVSLFDGKTLKGWTQRNGTATYKVEDGVILGTTTKGSPNSFLCSDKPFCDFELTFEVKVDEELNSGMMIRARSSKDFNNERVHGPQVEIEGANKESGYIYSEATGRGWLSPKQAPKAPVKMDEWNQFKVLAVGPRVQTWINGEKVEDLTDEASSQCGFLGLQVHGVGDRGPFEVRWRNIKIKDLNPEKSAKAESEGVMFKPAPDVKKK